MNKLDLAQLLASLTVLHLLVRLLSAPLPEVESKQKQIYS